MVINKSEYMQNYNKDYYTKNKGKLLQDAIKKIRCEVCGVECSKSNMSKHIKTEKHKLHLLVNQNAQ